MKRFGILLVFFFGVVFSLSAQKQVESVANMSCENAILHMFTAIESLKTAKFELISTERNHDKMLVSTAFGTIQYHPKKLFFRSFDDKGSLTYEVMYIEGENHNNALVSPNGFPYFNLNLNPLGSTIRNNRHLSILDAGGVYLVDMIKIGMQQYAKKGNLSDRLTITKLSDTETKLIINNNDYGFTSYTIQKGESMRDICYKLGVPEFKIVELNESVSDFDDIHEGQIIKVPTVYASKFELIIRNNDFIPTVVKIYDEKGLFASYEYVYFEKNPTVNSQTFNKDNPAYTF